VALQYGSFARGPFVQLDTITTLPRSLLTTLSSRLDWLAGPSR
jgi:hypothetical protein